MNREIKFKAKRLNNGEWAVGDLYHNIRGHDCIGQLEGKEVMVYPVDPSTVCQYTGLKDEVGNLIYENDIIQDDGADRYIIEYKNCCFVMIDPYGNYCGLLSDIIDEGVLRRDWILLGSKFDKEV